MAEDEGLGDEGAGDGDPPSHEASASAEAAADESADPERIVSNKHRRLQVARTGGRKLFDEAAQAEFLEWFAATCNFAWSAEEAGFNYKTVMRHRMNDPRFREGCERALEQGYARLEAKRLETKKQETPIGIEGDRDAPEMEAMEPERMDRILRDQRMAAKHPERVRRQGRRPRVASNAEVKEELAKRLTVFGIRISEEEDRKGPEGGEEAPPPRCARSPSAGNPGEDS
ncbi:MAG TPA: hypothetical protein VJS15_08645 [Allosphingosinicella sp.]|nr:hypothetical protein [Allosphingosinicella sp.]